MAPCLTITPIVISRAHQFADLVAVKRLFALGQDAQQGQADRARAELFLEFFMGFLYSYQLVPPFFLEELLHPLLYSLVKYT